MFEQVPALYVLSHRNETGRRVPEHSDGPVIMHLKLFCSQVDHSLGPTWEQNSLRCSEVEVLWGQLGMFQGQHSAQLAPQTAPYGLLLQTE